MKKWTEDEKTECRLSIWKVAELAMRISQKIDEGVDVFDLKPMLAAARAQLETADELIAQAAFNQEVTRKATHTPAPGRFKA